MNKKIIIQGPLDTKGVELASELSKMYPEIPVEFSRYERVFTTQQAKDMLNKAIFFGFTLQKKHTSQAAIAKINNKMQKWISSTVIKTLKT